MHFRILGRVGLVIVFLGAVGARVTAQGAGFTGTVTRDSNRTGVDSAEVTIAALNRSTTTSSLGEFRLDGARSRSLRGHRAPSRIQAAQ